MLLKYLLIPIQDTHWRLSVPWQRLERGLWLFFGITIQYYACLHPQWVTPVHSGNHVRWLTSPSFFTIKPTRRTNFPNLFWHETLHVSGSSSAHHQDFIRCTIDTGIYHASLKRAFEQDQGPARKLSSKNLYDIYQCRMYSE